MILYYGLVMVKRRKSSNLGHLSLWTWPFPAQVGVSRLTVSHSPVSAHIATKPSHPLVMPMTLYIGTPLLLHVDHK